MKEITSNQLTPEIHTLFDADDPAGLRCTAVLKAITSGQIWVDVSDHPTWAILREAAYSTFYLGGSPDSNAIASLIQRYAATNEVLIGLWPNDPRWGLIPPNPHYDGWVIDLYNRIAHPENAIVPDGSEIRRVDTALLTRSVDYESHIQMYGSPENALDHLLGVYLMRGDDILCEAFAGPLIDGVRELGVNTPEPHRRNGYATVACEHLAQLCEEEGHLTYWNCNKQNVASHRLAHTLGYQTEREYRLVAWLPPE